MKHITIVITLFLLVAVSACKHRKNQDGEAQDTVRAHVSVRRWVLQTPDSTSEVGWWTSLAIVNGNPAISYFSFRSDSNFLGDLKYVRANDASGTTWGAPVTVDSAGKVGMYASLAASLAVINGNPAISYYDAAVGNLKYMRANDASGTTWGKPVTLDSAGEVGWFASLAVNNGNPAISYYDNTNFDLKYVRANDASGTTWGAPVKVDRVGDVGQYATLAVVNGNPAISYYDNTNFDLKYVLANDASGTTWGAPVTVDSAGDVGMCTSLAVVNGNPAISYSDLDSDLKYVRANDISGTTWGAPEMVVKGDLAEGEWVGEGTSLAIVNGNPAISYCYCAGKSDLKYVRANDASGTTWGAPVKVDYVGDVDQYPALAVINGHPAISYCDCTTGNLKFAIWN